MSDPTELERAIRHLRSAQDGLRKATGNMGSPVLRAAVTEMVNAVEATYLAAGELGQTKDETADQVHQIVQVLKDHPDMPDSGEAISMVARIRKIVIPKRALTVRDLLVKLDHVDPDAPLFIDVPGSGDYPVTEAGEDVHSLDDKGFFLRSNDLFKKED